MPSASGLIGAHPRATVTARANAAPVDLYRDDYVDAYNDVVQLRAASGATGSATTLGVTGNAQLNGGVAGALSSVGVSAFGTLIGGPTPRTGAASSIDSTAAVAVGTLPRSSVALAGTGTATLQVAGRPRAGTTIIAWVATVDTYSDVYSDSYAVQLPVGIGAGLANALVGVGVVAPLPVGGTGGAEDVGRAVAIFSDGVLHAGASASAQVTFQLSPSALLPVGTLTLGDASDFIRTAGGSLRAAGGGNSTLPGVTVTSFTSVSALGRGGAQLVANAAAPDGFTDDYYDLYGVIPLKVFAAARGAGIPVVSINTIGNVSVGALERASSTSLIGVASSLTAAAGTQASIAPQLVVVAPLPAAPTSQAAVTGDRTGTGGLFGSPVPSAQVLLQLSTDAHGYVSPLVIVQSPSVNATVVTGALTAAAVSQAAVTRDSPLTAHLAGGVAPGGVALVELTVAAVVNTGAAPQALADAQLSARALLAGAAAGDGAATSEALSSAWLGVGEHTQAAVAIALEVLIWLSAGAGATADVTVEATASGLLVISGDANALTLAAQMQPHPRPGATHLGGRGRTTHSSRERTTLVTSSGRTTR